MDASAPAPNEPTQAANGPRKLVERDARGYLYGVYHDVYRDPEIYQRELKEIYGKTWVFVGLELEVPNPGDFKATFVGEIPVVLVRDESGKLHVFENVCLHRGAKLVRRSCGNAKALTCMYHQWTYALDGQLTGVALPKGFPEGFRTEDYRLSELPRVDVFAGMVYASYDAKVMPLGEYLNDFRPILSEVLKDGQIELLGYQRYHVKANWKLFIENTIDAYHPGLLHIAIMRDRSAYQYRPGVGANYKYKNGHGMLKWPVSIVDQSSWDPETDLPLTLCKTRRPGGWDYVSNIFPNVMVLQIEDILTIRQLVPRGVDRTDVITYNLALKGESEEIKRHRAWVVTSQFGIAGVASLDDKVAMEAVQAAANAKYSETLLLRGDLTKSEGDLTDEVSLRGFYEMWSDCLTA
jgi:phenylpropionate dioxygenase-like ring-hydroxylating dioxygenase large terminal subunit